MSGLKKRIIEYARLIKVEHTLFSLPMLFSGAIIGAHGWPPARTLILIILAGFSARALALILNRLIDREIDSRNPRTLSREIPAKRVSVKEAWLLGLLSLASYLLFAFLLGRLCLLLSPIPVIIFAVYPFLKRVTPLAHFGVGAALSMAPLGGYIGTTLRFPLSFEIIFLGAFVFFWASGFDIIYSTLDEEFDKKHGLFSLPATLGIRKSLQISGLLHIVSFISLLLGGLVIGVHPGSLGILLLIGVFLYLEHKFSSDVDMAFFKGNAVVSFLVFVLANALIYDV